MTYARPFRLHHSTGTLDGAVFPSGHVIVIDEPGVAFSAAPTLEQLLLGYHRARLEWPDTDTTVQAAEERVECWKRRATEWERRAGQAEAALERVQHVAALSAVITDPARVNEYNVGRLDLARAVLAALDDPAPATTAPALHELLTTTIRYCPSTVPEDIATAVVRCLLPGARITAALARGSEATVQRTTALYERWVKAGPPPLGASLARWWDQRLVELRAALLPPNNPPTDGGTEMVTCPSCLGAPAIPRQDLAIHNHQHHPHHTHARTDHPTEQ